uniref:Uncharacterized protein n=1 Tax=Glossina palpalis gambiensis TaxID=67801 RepID=A0A1B0AQ35_9MUSC
MSTKMPETPRKSSLDKVNIMIVPFTNIYIVRNNCEPFEERASKVFHISLKNNAPHISYESLHKMHTTNMRKKRFVLKEISLRNRPRPLSAGGVRLMDRILKKARSPKAAVMALNNSANEWIARRVQRKIVLMSAVQQKKPVLSQKTVFYKQHNYSSVGDRTNPNLPSIDPMNKGKQNFAANSTAFTCHLRLLCLTVSKTYNISKEAK